MPFDAAPATIGVEWCAPDAEHVTIATEDFETVLRDGATLRAEHAAEVGKPNRFNIPLARVLTALTPTFIMTARHAGEMVGYVVMVVGATIVAEGMVSATQAFFYVTPEHRGRIGIRLLAAAVAECWARGADDILLYAGIAGDGPRLGPVYLRHLGAEPCGSLFRLTRPGA